MPDDEVTTHRRWAHLRFSIIGPLLAAPPARGELEAELGRLAAKEWLHPVTARPARFGISTIQRWYYAARREKVDPVGILRRKIRKDAGEQSSLNADLGRVLEAQYRAHRRWSYQLHADNLDVLVQENPRLGLMPSYSSVRRYMKRHGWIRQSRVPAKGLQAWSGLKRVWRRAKCGASKPSTCSAYGTSIFIRGL